MLSAHWRKAPYALVHHRSVLLVVFVASGLAALASSSSPFVTTAAASEALKNKLAELSSFGTGLEIRTSKTVFGNESAAFLKFQADRRDAAAVRLGKRLGHVETPVFTTEAGPVQVAGRRGGSQVVLMARTGALAHVKVLAQASGTGVWLADITARAAGLKPGDSLRVDGLQSFSHPSSPHLRVKGIYRALAHSAETDYWANFYQDIYPQCLDCGIPSPFAFVDETSLFHLLAGRNAGLENIVELPVDPNGVTLADARTLNRKFDAVRNELRRSALGEKLGCSRLAARSQCRAISSLSAAVILADRNASAVTPAVTLLADLGTGIALAVSVRENVEYPVRLAGGDYARAQLLLERLGLAELAERPPQETSIGQQQRTALARALVLEPAVLLADEPTSHQDAGWRDAVWHVLVEAADAGTSCLIATHEEQIADYATRVWKVDSGVVTSS